MKDTRFLTHDCNARNDPKLLKVQMAMGGEGLGLYWCLVEMLWENEGYLPVDYDLLAFNLRWVTADKVRSLVEDYGLFENDGSRFWSNSALERIKEKQGIIEQRKQAGRKGNEVRWGGKSDEIPEPSQSDSGAIANGSQEPRSLFIYLFKNKNKSFSFSFEKSAEQEMLVAYFTFLKNVPLPNKETQKFLAYNNTDGRCWADMSEKARRLAFEGWEQKPSRRPRFDLEFLGRWAAFYDALFVSGAPVRVRMAALADGIKYEADGGTFRLWCPDCLREWVESHIPDAGKALMSVAHGECCERIAYRKCAESFNA